ncbi:serine phosphatase RsbU (regulator of sigma subunit) [Streptomyces sp. B3I8]|nr:serine phosphatase RsbU (regulator of sigma subunit) [Streptomyces sp. B3I8]
MGAIPTQRDTWARPAATSATLGGMTPTGDDASVVAAYGSAGWRTVARTSLPGGALAPGAARRFVRETLAAWTARALPGAGFLTDRLCDDAEVVVSELVTNAVVHAGTDVVVECRLEYAGCTGSEDFGGCGERAGGVVEAVGPIEPIEAMEAMEAIETIECLDPLADGARPPDGALLSGTGSLWDSGAPSDGGSLSAAGSLGVGVPPFAGALGDAGGPGERQDGGTRGPYGDEADTGGRGASGSAALVVEVSDRHPSRPVRDEGARAHGTPEYGRGLRLVAALAQEWGITYRRGTKCVWARLAGGDGPGGEREFGTYGAVTDTAEAPAPVGTSAAPAVVGTVTGPYVAGTAEAPAVVGPSAMSDPAATGGARSTTPEAPSGDAASPHARPGPAGRTADGTGDEPADGPEQDWLDRGALSFLAEASDLLAGQLDEDLVTALAGQLLVPRLAEWCAVWLEDGTTDPRAAGTGTARGSRLARVWHSNEDRLEELRRVLEKDPPRLPDAARTRPVPVSWPAEALDPPQGETAATERDDGADGGPGADGDPAVVVTPGAALAYRLIVGGRPLGTVVIGRSGVPRFPDGVSALVEDLCRRVAQAVGAARQYARQANISRVLQRGLLPGAVAEIPGMRSALVYEPRDQGGPSGDFYDLFPAGHGRWSFAIGDVQGKGPEAAVVIGLARPWLRLLAREGYAVPEVLDRLNQLLLDDATEASDAAARALVAAGVPDLGADDGPQNRFLSLLYGELAPVEGGVRCTLASAGHPLPLVLAPDGSVRTAAQPQTLLGVVEDATYDCETFELRSGDTLLCVTDGVTERRHGPRQFDDADGLADALAGCTGLTAERVADRIRRLVHDFGDGPPEDDLALLVLQAE